MAFREILKYPDRRLKQKSIDVKNFDDSTRQLVADLWDTLNVAGGAGLSAPQIGFHKRVIFIACGGFKGEMINPVIVESSNPVRVQEGCLSFPGIWEKMDRAESVKVNFANVDGEEKTAELTGVAAQAVQHEIDHLDGKLMIDYFSSVKRNMMSKKVKKVLLKADTVMHPPEEKEKRRIRQTAHLSRKELKKRKANRTRSRKKR